MQTTVVGSGTLSFWWKVSSEANFDFLKFYLDEMQQDYISGTGRDWAQKTYTLAVWVKPEGLGPDGNKWHPIFSAWCAPVNDPFHVSVQEGKLVANIEQPAGVFPMVVGPVEDGKGMHVAVVKKHRDLILYVNGQRIATALVPNTVERGAQNLGIGCNPNFPDSESFRGSIADVLFSREAMTDAQVASLAAR